MKEDEDGFSKEGEGDDTGSDDDDDDTKVVASTKRVRAFVCKVKVSDV